MRQQKVSVICPVLNEVHNVDVLIGSLLEQTRLPDEIILVDGGSTDGTQEAIKTWTSKGAPIRLLHSLRPSISQQRNMAIHHATSEIIACTNADCALSPDWLEALIGPFLEGEAVDVVSGVYLGRGKKPLQKLLSIILQEKFVRPDRAIHMPQANSMAFRRRCWEEVGGFPEWTGKGEDMYFDMALRKAGFKFAFAPKAVAYWEVRATYRHLFQQYFTYSAAESRVGISSADLAYMVAYLAYIFRAGKKLTLSAKNPVYLLHAFLVALTMFLGHAVGRLAGKTGRLGARRPSGGGETSHSAPRGLRVLQVTPYFLPSFRGQEQTVAFLSHALVNTGQSADIMTIDTEKAERSQVLWGRVNVNRHASCASYRRWRLSPGVLASMSRARGYDVVHMHLPFPTAIESGVLWSKLLRVPLVATLHSEPAPSGSLTGKAISAYSWLTRNVTLRLVDRLLVFSPSWAGSLQLPPSVRAKIKVIRPAIDTNRFSPSVNGSALRDRYGFGPNDEVALFVGAIHYWERRKGVHHLVHAMVSVARALPTARLVLAGPGRLEDELQQLVDDLGLSKNVVLAGAITGEQVPEHYAMCDVFVLPSEYEAFGYVVLEALATGKPAIVSDVPGLKENVRHGVTGLVVPPRSPDKLAEAMLTLLTDKSLRLQMGEEGRKEMLSRTWEDVARNHVEVYREVLRD